jgi:hypothetical protein
MGFAFAFVCDLRGTGKVLDDLLGLSSVVRSAGVGASADKALTFTGDSSGAPFLKRFRGGSSTSAAIEVAGDDFFGLSVDDPGRIFSLFFLELWGG